MKNKMELRLARDAMLLVVSVWGLVACGGSGSNNLAAQPSVPIQPVAINVLSAWVTPSYTLDTGGGAATFPASEYNDGNMLMRGTADSTDVTVLGSSHDASPQAVRVVQDSYDILFQHETGDAVPQNVNTRVQSGEVVNADRALPVAVTAWTVTPTFTHTGGVFPPSEYDDGVFYLRPTTSGGEDIFLGNSHTVSPDPVLVMEGSYDVIYALETGGDLVPNNQNAVVMSSQNITADTALAVTVNSVRFQFDATLDTAAFPNSQYQSADFFLRNAATGDLVELGASSELPVTMFVVEGTYDIIYRHTQGNSLPINTDAVVASNVVINGANPSQSIDIGSVAVTPAFTLDGVAFPQSEYSDANFYLRGTNNNNDVMFLGASELVPTAVRVISSDFDTDVGVGMTAFGAYDVLYRHETGESVPQNTNAVVMSNQTLNADGPLAVPVTSIDVAGVFTLNGNSFPGDAGDSVQFLLRDSSNESDEFLFGFSDVNNEAVKLIPGTYHVVMDHLDGDAVPQNEMHEVDFNNVLNADQTLDVNVQAVRVDPSFTLDGMGFPASIYQSALFYLRETHVPKNRIFLGKSYKANEPVMVIKEDYDVVYEHFAGSQVPQNMNKNVGLADL